MKQICAMCGLVFGVMLISTENSQAVDWMLRVETSNRACHVQLKTAAPIGEDFKGPFSSRKRACQEAASQYDRTLSDQSKCWTYGRGTVSGCGDEEITLPPRG